MGKRMSLSLRFLFVTTFLGQMIAGVVGISVPIYADMLSASPFLVGVIGAAGGLTYSFMPLVSGMLSDKFRRKAFISASLFSYAFSCTLYSLVTDPFMLVFIKTLEWISIAAFWPAMEALLADSSEENLEETLKRFNISWGSAMVIGPMVGGLLISGYTIKAPFLFSLTVSFSLGILSLMLLREPPRRQVKIKQRHYEAEEGSNSHYEMVTALSSILLFSSIGGVNSSIFPAYATDLGIPPYEIGLVIFISGASRTAAFYLADRIESKLRRIGMFLAGSLILAFASVLTVNSYTTLAFLVCFLLFGFGAGISYAASISTIIRRWGSSRGYAAGLFESLIGSGYFLGPLIGGIVSEYAPNAPYIYGFILSLTVLSIQLALNKRVITFSRSKAEEI